jgi:hypothetical protein
MGNIVFYFCDFGVGLHIRHGSSIGRFPSRRLAGSPAPANSHGHESARRTQKNACHCADGKIHRPVGFDASTVRLGRHDCINLKSGWDSMV